MKVRMFDLPMKVGEHVINVPRGADFLSINKPFQQAQMYVVVSDQFGANYMDWTIVALRTGDECNKVSRRGQYLGTLMIDNQALNYWRLG